MKIVFPGIMAQPGTSLARKTGSWRTGKKPEFLHQRCSDCGLCVLLCPEGCITRVGDNTYEIDLDYCKGCAICAEECPVDDIKMVVEVR